MTNAWRIVPVNCANTAFSGEGARLYGGRWNSPGTPVVYVSEEKAVAILELVVHTIPNPPPKYKAFHLSWNDLLTKRIETLPRNWRVSPPTATTQKIGDTWVKMKRSAILAVPSVILPDEINFILNPAHPDFKKIHIEKARNLFIDPRLA